MVKMQNETNLIWIDLEMTGLSTFNDQILEIATLVTDSKLEVIALGPELAIHQKDAILAGMDDWNQKQHQSSGLIKRVQESSCNLATAEQQTLQFLKQWVPAGVSPMCGNSICQDRRFLARLMPQLEAFFHYRNLDVSTLKELVQRWSPHLVRTFEKDSQHRAMADIHDSIAELRYYRTHFLRVL
ncbi:oligoribonuclease [Achromatium sp. WMS1]|nr:oligoribonuclease [Achromatium sp. WMS1]